MLKSHVLSTGVILTCFHKSLKQFDKFVRIKHFRQLRSEEFVARNIKNGPGKGINQGNAVS